MRHDEIGCGLARRIEQADGIAMDKVEGPYRVIVGGYGGGGRAGEAMSLGILDHGWLHYSGMGFARTKKACWRRAFSNKASVPTIRGGSCYAAPARSRRSRGVEGVRHADDLQRA